MENVETPAIHRDLTVEGIVLRLHREVARGAYIEGTALTCPEWNVHHLVIGKRFHREISALHGPVRHRDLAIHMELAGIQFEVVIGVEVPHWQLEVAEEMCRRTRCRHIDLQLHGVEDKPADLDIRNTHICVVLRVPVVVETDLKVDVDLTITKLRVESKRRTSRHDVLANLTALPLNIVQPILFTTLRRYFRHWNA